MWPALGERSRSSALDGRAEPFAHEGVHACAMGLSCVLHYARLAPLKGIAEDVKKALVDKGAQDKQIKLVAKMREVTKILNKQQVTYEVDLKSTHDKVKKIEEDAAPRKYVQNRVARITHRIMASYEDAGREAMTICSWNCALGKFRVLKTLPCIRKEVCKTCLPEVRATLP